MRNPFVEQVAAALLGRCALSFCSGNTNTPGSGTQPMHCDGDWAVKSAGEAAAKGLAWPPAATSLIANFGVGDISAACGAPQTAHSPSTRSDLGLVPTLFSLPIALPSKSLHPR